MDGGSRPTLHADQQEELMTSTLLQTLQESANVTSAPVDTYDHNGAMWFVIAVVMLYGSAIIFMIGSATRRHSSHSEDAQVRIYLQGLEEARKQGDRDYRGFLSQRFSSLKIYAVVNQINFKQYFTDAFASTSEETGIKKSQLSKIEEEEEEEVDIHKLESASFDPPSFDEITEGGITSVKGEGVKGKEQRSGDSQDIPVTKVHKDDQELKNYHKNSGFTNVEYDSITDVEQGDFTGSIIHWV